MRQSLPALPLLAEPNDSPAVLGIEAPRALVSPVLGALAPRLLEDVRPLYCADAGNCFDPYAFSTCARRAGFDPRGLLRRVFLTRAFTIHQLSAVAADLLAPLAERSDAPMVAVLGVEHLFLEETLPLGERRAVLAGVLARLAALRRGGVPVLLTWEPAREGRDWWTGAVHGACDTVAVIADTGATARRLERRGAPLWIPER